MLVANKNRIMNTKVFLIAIMLLFSFSTFANDSLSIAYKRIGEMEQSLKRETESRSSVLNDLNAAKRVIGKQSQTIDSLKLVVEQNSRNIKTTADEMGVKIDETNTSLETKADSSDVKTKSIIGVVFLVLLLVICILVYLLLRKKIAKGSEDITALKEKSEKLNEDILNRMSSEMEEMQKISSSLKALSEMDNTAGTNSNNPDHSLIKTLADRITFMEMTLYKMDSKVRGYKQLTKSIAQMKDNLLANGYELVDMLGKPYDGGMKVTANFIEDENLEEGQQIITGVIKPQINYKGLMIQAAQITVSQN